MKVTYKLINDVFRGKIYGNHDIFTARSFADFVNRHEVDLDQAVNAYDGTTIVATLLYAIRGERAWMSLIGVLPQYRKDGIARTLFIRTIDLLLAAGIRSMEFETYTRNNLIQAMYAPFGFSEVDRLCMWTRRARSRAHGLPRAKKHSLASIEFVKRGPAACWQRESASIARATASSLIECDGAYAYVKVRDGHAIVLDAGAKNASAARKLVAALDAHVPYDITLLNEPESSPLSKELARGGWRVFERQHRMMRTW